MNPAALLKLNSSFKKFNENHPKFLPFLGTVNKKALEEGTIIEINVTNPAGETISSNIRVQKSDLDMFNELQEIIRK